MLESSHIGVLLFHKDMGLMRYIFLCYAASTVDDRKMNLKDIMFYRSDLK